MSAILKIDDLKEKVNELAPNFTALGISETEFLREMGFVVQAFMKNPALKECEIASIKTAVYNLALTGLSLNPVLKEAYFIPRKDKTSDKKAKCLLEPSYMGLIQRATRGGGISNVRGECVFEKDEFNMSLGTNPSLTHVPALRERGEFVGAYIIKTLPDGKETFRFMNKEDIEKRRKVSKLKDSGPWKEWYDQQAIKTVIRNDAKTWPAPKDSNEKHEQFMKLLDVMNQNDGLPDLVSKSISPKAGVKRPMALPDITEGHEDKLPTPPPEKPKAKQFTEEKKRLNKLIDECDCLAAQVEERKVGLFKTILQIKFKGKSYTPDFKEEDLINLKAELKKVLEPSK